MKVRALLLLLVACLAANAAIITPDSFGGPYCMSPAFGAAACSITDQYKDGGLVFSQAGVGTAVYDDGVDAWGGINGSGNVDLIAPVNGMIVLPGTTTPATTDYILVEAGYSAGGSLLLTAYDEFGAVLGTRANGLDGVGPNGRTLMILSLPGIRSFSVSTPGSDTFGVDGIELGNINGGEVPEPATYGLMAAALAGFAVVRRRRSN